MPVHKIEADADGIRIWPSASDLKERTVTDVRTRLPLADKDDRRKQADLMAAELLAELDTVTLLTDLPRNAPARLADPARPDLFWDGAGNIVGRAVTVEVEWSADAGRFIPTIKRTT